MTLATPTELSDGVTLLDRYTVLDRFATGGMADIYRAHDSRLDRIVCVKLLRSVLGASGSSRAGGGSVYEATYTHFLQEARALSKLSHPNTLRIYDFGFLELGADAEAEAGPRPLQVSEFLDGGNLDALVRARGGLPPVEVLAVVDRMAGATAEAHGAGIIHRDIKPSNILFSQVGTSLMPKLADFGIARNVLRRTPGARDAREPARIPLYSPRWAAPEQIAGRAEGPATDVYALALVAAFMISGKALFEVAGIEETYPERVAGDGYVRSRLALHSFTPDVARAIMEGLRTDPQARTQSPFDLFAALSRAFGTPRATLPTNVLHSGGVKSATPEREPTSVSRVRAFSPAPRSIAPPEQWLDVGGRRVRVVVTHEKLDVAMTTAAGAAVNLRVTLLPGRGARVRVNLKGLNCFVAKPGGAASPALVTEESASAELVSPKGERFGAVRWSFGEVEGDCRVFSIAGAELVVPFPQGEQAVAIELAPEHEVLVICRRESPPGGSGA